MKLLGTATDGIMTRFSFLVDANNSGAERSAQIVICDNGGSCHSATIIQKKHTAWYLKGFRGASKLRGECAKLEKLSDMDWLIRHILEEYAGANEEQK